MDEQNKNDSHTMHYIGERLKVKEIDKERNDGEGEGERGER